MKNIIIAIASVFTLFSCSPTPPTNEEIAEQAVVEGLLDPNSWELISSEIIDTMTVSDDLTIKSSASVKLSKQLLIEAQSKFKIAKLAYGTDLEREYFEEGKRIANNGKYWLDNSQILLDSAKSIQGTPQDTILYVRYQVKGYATSRDGQKRIGEWNVRMKNNQVIETQQL